MGHGAEVGLDTAEYELPTFLKVRDDRYNTVTYQTPTTGRLQAVKILDNAMENPEMEQKILEAIDDFDPDALALKTQSNRAGEMFFIACPV